MTKQILQKPSSEESTISRQTRNAFFTAIIFVLASLINFAVSATVSLSSKMIVSYLDSVVTFSFFIITIISTFLIRKGKKEKGVWLLIISFVLTLALRNALTTNLDKVLGILALTTIPLIGMLTLKPEKFNLTLITGIFSSSFYVAFNILASRYLPPYRQLSEDVPTMVRTITIAVIVISLIFIITLYQQHRFLLISSKITLVMVFFVLFPILLLSMVGAVSLRKSLAPRQEVEMHIKAAFVADSVDVFIRMNKNEIRANSQISIFEEYLSLPDDASNIDEIEKQVFDNLYSLRRKNISQISSYAILDISGKNLLDTTSENIGNDESETNYFIQTQRTGLPFVSDIIRDPTSNNYFLYFSAPIYSATTGEMIGIIRSEYRISALQEYINNYMEIEEANDKKIFVALLTEKEVTPIDDKDPSSVYLILRNSENPDFNLKSITPLTTNIITPLQITHLLPSGSTAQLSLEVPDFDEGLRNRSVASVFEAQAFPRENKFNALQDVIATADITEASLPWIIVISQDLKTFNAPFQRQNNTNTLLAILIAITAAVLAYFGSSYLTKPLLYLANTAEQVAKGDLGARAKVNSEDELGILGNAFNSMTDQLNALITTLEDRVTERTQDLERSSQHLRAAVEVGKAAASLRSLDELLSQTTELINKQFGFYHAGIFLIDTYGKYAVLKAANSSGGRRMLARAHKLKVGAEGIVGYVTQTGEARIALDVGQDAVFFNNPDLPQTRSEMALPLIAGGKILGALDIQSTEGEAFTEEDTITLQVLADQIAIAIENARLFEESRKTLVATQRAYGEQSLIGWQELIHQEKNYGYRSSSDGNIYPIQEKTNETLAQTIEENQTNLDENDLVANIPITVRGKAVGAIRLVKPDNAQLWTQQDLALAEVLTTELSRAMDSARLFDETRQQADRERVVGEIANKMQETMNVESVVRLAADELYKLLDLELITIYLNAEDDKGKEETA